MYLGPRAPYFIKTTQPITILIFQNKENGVCQPKNGVVVNGKQFIENGQIVQENGKLSKRVNGTSPCENGFSLAKDLNDKKKG